ncbi:putative disease resistance protein At5g05400 [Gossypium hirsutum]|uniref:Disease resistance protein At5g05400 n=1 Tax=Gossypium hirsutum TaxID=3635 RepID=A0ABM3BZI7_GOSHI|nr:putative disease resistance protein At5g05400 [Gossypium hirsutum]
MAGEFFSGAASNAVGTLMVDYLVKPIERRLRYLFRFHKLIEDLHQQQKNLNREQTRVEEDVKEAKLQIQTQVIEDYVDEWLTNVENALKDVQNLDSRVGENKRCFRLCPNWCWRYQLGKEIEKKTVYISKLVEDSHFERIGHRAELPGLQFFTSKDILASKSSTAAFNKIMEALKDDEVNMIGVWGMGGVGKTTLVKEVGKKTKELGCFRKVIEVVVSQKSIIENIQDKIADFLDLKFEKKTKEGRAGELWLRLENEEKVLIILDDMWNKVHLKDIGIPLNENGKGCKIILTTRLLKVCESMECQVFVPIDVLDDDEAWTLFRMKANLNERVSRDILEEAEKVAKECKGLPVAIVTLATALESTKTRKGWEVARKKLESSRLVEIGNIGEEEKNAYLCIKMSYEHLKKETNQKCFLLCALYPEDHSINVEDLVRYAWCLELFGKADSIEEVRIQVLGAIDYLKDSSLLLKDGDGDGARNVKLHDIVRDVALWIASEEKSDFMIKSRLELLNKNSESSKAISLLDNEEKKFPGKLMHSKLEILLLKNCDIQGTCFLAMRELKVLNLTVAYDSERIISLYALTFLPKLRALHLENFKDFSFLGNLKTLEILSLDGWRSENLTNELGRLENLKILDLTKCIFSLSFPSNVIRRLSQLEELYLPELGIEISSDTFLEINFLTRLTSLSLGISFLHFPPDFEFPKLEKYKICLSRERGILSLMLDGARSLKIEQVFPYNAVSQLLGNLECLQVSDIKDEYVKCLTNRTQQKVPVPMILRSLKQVRIERCNNIKVVFQMEEVEENEAPFLSNLKILHLKGLPYLSCIWELPTQHVRLESLVELTIERCSRLKSLFSLSLGQSLILLEKLDISFCDELTQIVAELEEISSTINSHTSLCFPKLTMLRISNCDGLEYIFPTSLAPQGLQGLTLTIRDCPQLKQVFRVAKGNMLQHQQCLISLLSFSVSGCPQLTDSVVHLEAEKVSIEAVRLSAFKEWFKTSKQLKVKAIKDHNLVPEANEDGLNGVTSLQLRDCLYLECLVDTTTTATKNGPTSAFTHLETLFIADMLRLEALCKGQPAQGFLKNLKHLEVRECSKFQVVDELLHNREENQEHPLSNLQSLILYELPELRWIFKGSSHSFTLQSLKVVNIDGCGKLKSLFSSSLIQSLVLLEQLKIQDCHELVTIFNDGEIESKTSSLPLRLPKLKTLFINWCSKLECVVPITLAQGLPALASLSVCDCHELKQVFGMPNEKDGVQHHGSLLLPSLQDLKLISLRNLTSFVPQNYIVKAPSLKRLKANDCSKVTNLPIQQANNELELTLKELTFAMEDIDGEDVKSCNMVNTQLGQKSSDFKNITLGTSEQLDLFNVVRLREVATNLRELTIHNCNNLTYIFPVMFIQNLSQLSFLEIQSCENLKEIIGSDDILASSSSAQGPQLEMKMVFPRLKQIVLNYLSKLESFSPVGYHLEFPCLDFLDISQCSKLITSFSADYLTLIVHAKTDEASQLNDTSPSREAIFWKRRRPTFLPQYKEEAEEISPFK